MTVKLLEVFGVNGEARDIVVTIPRGRQAQVEEEERQLDAHIKAGGKGCYYWEMKRFPRECPRRMYFVWDDAVRAYHDVQLMSPADGRIWLDPTINGLVEPVPMKGFQGFRYFKHDGT